MEDLQQDLGLLPRIVNVGISRSIGFAYLPGFLFQFQRKAPEVQINLVQESSARLLEMLDERALDIAIISSAGKAPRNLEVVHRFADDFTLIIPAKLRVDPGLRRLKPKTAFKMLTGQRWLMIRADSRTGRQLRRWLTGHRLEIEPAMEMDNFDLIINMVGLGLGVSIVPNRAVPLYLQRRNIRRISLRPKFTRELAVVIRKTANVKPHVQHFVENILF